MPPLLAVVLLVVLHPHGARGADELLLEGKGTMSALQCAKVRRARTRTLCRRTLISCHPSLAAGFFLRCISSPYRSLCGRVVWENGVGVTNTNGRSNGRRRRYQRALKWRALLVASTESKHELRAA